MGSEFFKFSTADELTMILRVVVAGLAGAVIGYERRGRNKPAGIRTMVLVSTGAAIFTLVSIFGLIGLGTTQDPGRIAAQVVTGIGFIGAGTMIRSSSGVVGGLTTASGIWIAASLGMAAGAGMYILAISGSLGAFAILRFFPRHEVD